MGMPPEELRAKLGPAPIPTAPVEVAVGIPADLLRRRPDVRRAERLAAAQCAQIGIAEADYYPAFSINGTLGYSAEQFPDLFRSAALNASVGPSFQWNLLNYGRILNNVRLQDARFQELVATYQQTVLNANQEVENGLVTFLRAQTRTNFQTASVEDAEKAVKIVLAQYEAGTIDFTRVTQLEQFLVQEQDVLTQAQGEIATGLIQVYRALGGRLADPADRLPADRFAAGRSDRRSQPPRRTPRSSTCRPRCPSRGRNGRSTNERMTKVTFTSMTAEGFQFVIRHSCFVIFHRLGQPDRLAALIGARLGAELGGPFNRHDRRALCGRLRGNDVAHAKIGQLAGADLRLGQRHLHRRQRAGRRTVDRRGIVRQKSVAKASIARQGRHNRIMPRGSPMETSKPSRITSSSAGKIRNSRGLLSTCNTSSFSSATFCHADWHSWRNTRTIRAARHNSISVSGRLGGSSSAAPPSIRSIIGWRIAGSMSSISRSSHGSAFNT